MADPLSVISAIVGLSHLGMKLKMLLDDKYLCMVGAPAQIRTLDANLTSFCELMRQIRELSEEPDPIPSSSDDPKSSTSSAMAAARAEQRQKTKLNLAPVLRGCVVTLEALQDLLTRHADAVTSKSRGLKAFASFKWALNEKELAGLMNDLERYKSSIDIAVNYLTFLQSQELAEGQQRIEDGVESITQTNNAI
ncbi:hypothetical protein EDC01DRAFT_516666 [Geopyxis carbonaria]|nr:hypothetical protein EDC01DRAFT_516666 [Geopyxis carbonaria]